MPKGRTWSGGAQLLALPRAKGFGWLAHYTLSWQPTFCPNCWGILGVAGPPFPEGGGRAGLGAQRGAAAAAASNPSHLELAPSRMQPKAASPQERTGRLRQRGSPLPSPKDKAVAISLGRERHSAREAALRPCSYNMLKPKGIND